MNNYQVILKCSCGFEESILEMEENALQIHIGSSTEGESQLALDCKQCGAKLSLAVVKKIAPEDIKIEEDVPEEIRNEG